MTASQSAAHASCAAFGGHLPVIEDAEELSRLLEFGAQWTNATWDGDRAAWVWAATGRPVDFTALGTAAPADGQWQGAGQQTTDLLSGSHWETVDNGWLRWHYTSRDTRLYTT